MGRKRRKPAREGCLREIFEILVHPLIRIKPKNFHVQDWLEAVFHVKERTIKRYIAQKKFMMPGALRISQNLTTSDTKYRNVQRGHQVWIRVDSTMPNDIDVEVMNGVGNKTHIFRLTKRQLSKVMPNLNEKPFRKWKLETYSWERE